MCGYYLNRENIKNTFVKHMDHLFFSFYLSDIYIHKTENIYGEFIIGFSSSKSFDKCSSNITKKCNFTFSRYFERNDRLISKSSSFPENQIKHLFVQIPLNRFFCLLEKNFIFSRYIPHLSSFMHLKSKIARSLFFISPKALSHSSNSSVKV